MSRELFKFKGGVHPPEHKTESNARPIHAAPLSAKLVIPLRQHIGNPAKPLVSVGDRVLKGQMIGEADGTISAAVHASSSGIVTAIDLQPVPHISGLPDLCISIETDGRDEWIEHGPLDYRAWGWPASAARYSPVQSSSTPARRSTAPPSSSTAANASRGSPATTC